jgi:deoxyhypusine synthase
MVKGITKEKLRKAHDANYATSGELIEGVAVKGYDFENGFDLHKFLASYSATGMQATNLGKAIEIVKQMRKDNATIFLSYNSNMVSSGLREVIAYLVKNKLVHVLVTTSGGVEEDIMKTLKPFFIGDFEAVGKELRSKGVNRIGNVFVPNDRYIEFEKLMQKFLAKMHGEQKKTGHIHTASEFIHELGKEVNDENSIYYWATKNDIPTFCPALTDGSIGDMIYFFKQNDKKNADFGIEISEDMIKIVNIAINAKKTGIIILGGGFVKHHVCNANLYRNGADYAVFISTETEEGGSDSGARPDEAVSWGKIKEAGGMVKVFSDATLTFPLIVAGAFAKR